MNTFKKKALLTAVAAGLGVAGNAEAVFLISSYWADAKKPPEGGFPWRITWG